MHAHTYAYSHMHAHKELHAVAMKYQNCSQKNAFNAARRGGVCWISEGGGGRGRKHWCDVYLEYSNVFKCVNRLIHYKGGGRGERVIDENYLEFF